MYRALQKETVALVTPSQTYLSSLAASLNLDTKDR